MLDKVDIIACAAHTYFPIRLIVATSHGVVANSHGIASTTSAAVDVSTAVATSNIYCTCSVTFIKSPLPVITKQVIL